MFTRSALILTALVLLALAALAAVPVKKATPAAPSWGQVDQLIKDQKLEEASRQVELILRAAEKRKDEAEWTRALIREVQLRMGLHGYETAVRFLKDEPWPQGLLSRTTLELFYAHALVRYAEMYSWEIGKREKVESSGPVDLKAWTRDQILAEAQRAYASVWKAREALGSLPVGRLSEYVEANNFPPEVRGTLRDAVSYLFVNLLANSAFWTPAQSNDVSLLGVPALLEAAGPVDEARLSDPSVHPLSKIAAILGDLEGWHAAGKQRAAELEARLERLVRLHAALDSPSARALIREDLETRLPAFRDIEWWAMGQAELAQFREAEDVPDNLIRAREAALDGSRTYPKSLGAQRCNALIATIESPDAQMAAMSSDGLDRRSIELTHKNLASLSFRAYAIDLEPRIEAAQNYNLMPQGEEVRELLRSDRPAAEWTVSLPPTPDYKQHRTFVTPPIRKAGLYLVVSSVRDDFAQKNNRIDSVAILLGDLVLVTRPQPSAIEARVLSGGTGEPVSGAEVMLYAYDWNSGRRHHRLESKLADADGRARFDFAPGRTEANLFLVARDGKDYALDPSTMSMFKPQKPDETFGALIYTDRSIYRPQQKILWKVLAYRGRADLGQLSVAPETFVTVSLHDANGEVVEKKSLPTNSFGSAAGEFVIPGGRALGAWHLESSFSGNASVQVEEYKRPTFEVTWSEPAAPLRLNQPAALVGAARYYFGLPVSSGRVRWRVKRLPQYPPWWGWGRFASRGGEQIVAQGESPLKEDGTFEARFTPAASEESLPGARAITYRYEASADVTDEGGETRSAERAFRLGFVSVEAAVRMDAGFFREGVAGSVVISRSDLDGSPRAGKGSWRLTAIVEPEKTLLPAEMPPERSVEDRFATPGDRLRPRWDTSVALESTLRGWTDGGEKARGEVTHDAKGEAPVALPALAAGAWRLHSETRDEFGAVFETTKDFLVAGKRMPVKFPGVLLAEHFSVAAGENARLLAFSGLPGQSFSVETLRDGEVTSRRTLAGSDDSLLEMPVGDADRGGFGVRLTLVADHQLIDLTQSVFVPWDDKELKVSFATFRDKIRPGARETWRVTVQAPPGTPAEGRAAELLASMYDRSLDAFLVHEPPSVLGLYPNHTSAGYVRASLGEVRAQWIVRDDSGPRVSGPGLHGDYLKFVDGYGIGGPGGRIRMLAKSQMASVSDAAAEPVPAAMAVEGGVPVGVLGGVLARTDELKAVAESPARKEAAAPAPQLRSNFSETAFWKPQLLADVDGTAVIEFQVPDSVTSWNVWVHAVTRDLKGGWTRKETRSVKELMVRPYVPRFLREGDTAQLKIVVNNASAKPMAGQVRLEILDAETSSSALAQFGLTPEKAVLPFTAAADGGADVMFMLSAPKRVGSYSIQATAVSGDFSDGELRPVPVLPGRMQLSQSRFVTLKDGERRTMSFADMARGGDPSRIDEQLVVTVDAQLFYSVLNALPYLVNYPYECTEQTLNRFVSTGIVSALYRDYPAVAKMAQDLSKRETPLAAWAAEDPNRKMALEETPWLETARGGKDAGLGTINVLDPRIAKAQRETALAKLQKAQTTIGAFPWWPGGPPSPYMTLYILYGLAKASEFGVDVPKDMVAKGWGYLASQFRSEYARRMAQDKCDWEWLTFLDYVATCYPDPSWMGDALKPEERAAILRFSFKHWREHSPYLKGYLALTLKRMGRPADAKLVWASVMDSAKTERDLGTFWAPEDRSWLWYNDTIETQAFALRTLMELDPSDARRHGLVQWLLLNKKLNQWKSTRATAEVIYSLIWYLKKEGALSVREGVTVEAGGQTTTFAFEPDRYTGARNQVVIHGEKMDPKRDSEVAVQKAGQGMAFASASWHFSTEKLPEEDRGDFFSVSRKYFKRQSTASGFVLQPLTEGAVLAAGDEVEVHISLRSKQAAEYVHLRDPRAAGLEPENVLSRYKWDLGISWYEETRDSGSNFFFEWLPAGEYTFQYRLRANMAGTFKVGPATVQSMYAPEFAAYTSGATITVR